MIRYLRIRIELWLALSRRKAARATYSAASKRGAVTASHRQFERDPLISFVLGRPQ